MGGFEDGERYRGQQTQLPLEDPDQPEVKIPAVPQTKPSKPALPVEIHFMKGEYVNEHLHFFCQGYRPYGANPQYPKDHKYRGDSQMCDGCFRILDGVVFRAPFRCSKEKNGSKYFVHRILFNPNPLDCVDPKLRKTITAGLKWLWQDEGGKHVRRTKTKEPK
jgi:hypothetical protein